MAHICSKSTMHVGYGEQLLPHPNVYYEFIVFTFYRADISNGCRLEDLPSNSCRQEALAMSKPWPHGGRLGEGTVGIKKIHTRASTSINHNFAPAFIHFCLWPSLEALYT